MQVPEDPVNNEVLQARVLTGNSAMSVDKDLLHVDQAESSRNRYPSSNNGDGGHDVDSSTELWDEPEEDQPHCSHCSTSLHDQYTDTLRIKIKQQQMTLLEMKKTVKELEADKIQELELRRRVQEQSELIREKSNEVERLEKLLEEFDSVVQECDDLKLLLRLKDEEIKMLNKDVSKLSERVSDYNEIEAHNNDLQSELFSRDREVMSLKHSEERLRTTYLELVKKNSQLEEKLLEQDSRHEEQKQKFENSIMKLTNKLIQQRKRSEELEQANARAVRDCRLAVRLLQCASPASNSHSSKFHQSNKISFLFGDANNRPISSNDSKTIKKDLKQLRQNSFDDENSYPTTPSGASPPPRKEPRGSTPGNPSSRSTGSVSEQRKEEGETTMKRNHSTSCLESLHCMSRTQNPHLHRPSGAGCTDCSQESVSVLKDLLQGKKDAIHVLRVELGKRDKEIGLLRKKLTQNLSESINSKDMAPNERIENLETRVSFLNDENFNLKYQLEICRKMLDKLSGVAPHPS
ncbi:hypothetical protein ACHWQZ_G002549 [Mnemiopsis leidyi]